MNGQWLGQWSGHWLGSSEPGGSTYANAAAVLAGGGLLRGSLRGVSALSANVSAGSVLHGTLEQPYHPVNGPTGGRTWLNGYFPKHAPIRPKRRARAVRDEELLLLN